jgi:PilZ domain
MKHTVEQKRREPRFTPNQEVTAKVLGMMPGSVMQARVCDISGSGMRLRTPLPVPCGTRIEIEAREMLALGSVCRSEPDNGFYMLGVQISETGLPKRTLADAGRGGAKGPA